MPRPLVPECFTWIAMAIVLATAGRGTGADEPSAPAPPAAPAAPWTAVDAARRAARAAKEERRGEAPALVRWLEETADRAAREDDLARMVVLDALIQLHAAAGTKAIVPCFSRGSLVMAAAVVLAVKEESDGTLLAILDALDAADRRDEEEWLAIGNALAKKRTPGFPFRLLARFAGELRILADDRARPDARWLDPSGSVPGDGVVRIPAGFPAIPAYSLWPSHIHEALLVDGPRPIRASRVVHEGQFMFGVNGGSLRRDEARLEWIAALLGAGPGTLGVEWFVVRSIAVTSDREFLDRVRAARAELGRSIESLADRLRSAALLTNEERAAVVPRMRTTVRDVRKKPPRPLPDFPADWLEPPPPPPPPAASTDAKK